MKNTAIEHCNSTTSRGESSTVATIDRKPSQVRRCAIALALTCMIAASLADAQVNGVVDQPYLGWSTYSQQTLNGSFLNQANISAQSDAMLSSGLEAHGFRYINIDSGWMGSFDANGRPIPNTTTFPDIKALVAHRVASAAVLSAGGPQIPGPVMRIAP